MSERTDLRGLRGASVAPFTLSPKRDAHPYEVALRRIAKGIHLEDHDYTGPCNGRCAQKIALAALTDADSTPT